MKPIAAIHFSGTLLEYSTYEPLYLYAANGSDCGDDDYESGTTDSLNNIRLVTWITKNQ